MSNYAEQIEQLEIPIRLTFPVINVNTFELSRAEEMFREVAKNTQKLFVTLPFKEQISPPQINKYVAEADEKKLKGVVIFDMFFFDRMKSNPETMPGLKSSLATFEPKGVNFVIASKDTLNEEFVYHVALPTMDTAEILALLKEQEEVVQQGGVFNDAERNVIMNHALGLSHTQMKNVFTYCAYLKYKGKEYLSEIRKEKAHILRDVGLDVMESLSIDDVGGLENLKEFLRIRKAGWDRNLPVKGILLAGVPGGGKSLTAKAAADVFGTTLVRLDMGRFYSKYIGETERLFNRALATIEQIAPVVVLIDEVEKSFGVSDGGHEVTIRMLGRFLTWLQDRKEKIFIVATANRVQSMPPELMRAGRWDRMFFIDLPSHEERNKILEIHLTKQGADLADFDLPGLVKASDGYTGAEIEQAVIDAMYLANAHDEAVNQQSVLSAIDRVSPISKTRRADIDEIRSLKDTGFDSANVYEPIVEASKGRRLSLDI